MFAPEPFTEREAWLWILSSAAWSDKRVRVGKSVYDLQRGQLAFSTRFMASRWKWDHSRVSRFLKRLKTDTMIDTLATREATQITICNYNQYQFGRNTDETPNDTQNETATKHQRHKEEESNNLINKNSRGEDAEKVVPIRRYAFEGKIIKLDQPGMDRWQKTYHAIPDITAALQLADDYYSENPPKDNKWFFPVSKWLQKEHDQHCEKIRTANSRPDRSW
jgi:hypothetical protein